MSLVFDRVLAAPTADKLSKTLRQAALTAAGIYASDPPVRWAPGVAEVRRLLASAEGRHQWEDDQYGPAIAVAWWHDLLGRPHLRIAACRERDDAPGRGVLDDAPPLALLCPEQSLVRPGSGVLLLCACGACGTAAALGWMGDRCGPCHDRGDDAPQPPAAGLVVGEPNQVMTVIPTPDGGALASLNQFGRVIVWDLTTGKRRGTALTNARHGYFNLLPGPGGRLVGTMYGVTPTCAIGLWDTATDRRLALVEVASPALVFAPDGRTGYAVLRNREVGAFDIPAGTLQELPGLGPAHVLALRHDGVLLAALHPSSQTVALWDVAAGAPAGRFDLPGMALRGLTFSPDGPLFVLLEDDGNFVLFDVTGLRRVARLPLSEHPVLFGEPRFAASGRALFTLTLEPDRLRGWGVPQEPGTEAPVLFEARGGVLASAAALPDGRLMTFSSRQGRVRFWPAEVFQT
jgi:hypothetical protein